MLYKILIVEDDPTIRTQLQILLSGAGYEAEAVTDFDRAAEQFRAYGPHLVLLDIKLPGAGGFALCCAARYGLFLRCPSCLSPAATATWTS